MKNLRNKIVFLCCITGLFFGSCTETSEGFLDNKDDSTLDTEKVFSDSTYAAQFQAALYGQLARTIFAEYSGTSSLSYYADFDGATDNSRLIWNGVGRLTNAYTWGTFSGNGTNTGYTHFRTPWQESYRSIMRCNTLLNNIHKTPISDGTKEQYVAEARFLRAYYYYHMFRLYGGLPLLGEQVFTAFDYPEVPRSSVEDVVNYLVSELSEAGRILPDDQTGLNYGRPTSGAALALKAKILFIAASPLYNGGNVGSGENRLLVGYESFDMNRWQKAADALKVVIDLNKYELEVDNATRAGYGFYIATTTRVNKERIFGNLITSSGQFPDNYLLPKSRGGNAYQSPYQELVDAFPMDNGKTIKDPTSGWSEKDPYKNRDPRFGYSILYDGSEWIMTKNGPKERVNFYKGATNDGINNPANGATITGYLLRKFCREENVKGAFKNDSGFPFLRYADILLMYAEALTELDVDANRTVIEDILFKIRERAGIKAGSDNRYGIAINMNKQSMIDFIINERRIEFVSENGNRFFDLKRRKLFENLNKVWTSRCVWIKDPISGEMSYTIEPDNQHFFDSPRMYQYPIPLAEINSARGSLKQNPGW